MCTAEGGRLYIIKGSARRYRQEEIDKRMRRLAGACGLGAGGRQQITRPVHMRRAHAHTSSRVFLFRPLPRVGRR